MENLIVFQNHIDGEQELIEFLQNKGYTPFFVQTLSEFISAMDHTECTKTYMYIKNISDIRLIQTVKSLYEKMEINLIIPPHLKDIITLLKDNSFHVFDDLNGIL